MDRSAVKRVATSADTAQMPVGMLALLGLFGALWLVCALAMARGSSLESWLRYLDAALLMPALLALLALNLWMSWQVTPWLVELTGAVSHSAGRLAAPLAFAVCAPFPILGFICWRRWIRRLDRRLQ